MRFPKPLRWCFLPLVVLLMAACAHGADRSTSHTAQIADQAVAASAKMMQQHATEADVGAFLALCTDDLIYEDPVVNMRIEGKARIRAGMVSFLGVTRNARRVVTNRIAAANVVVLDQQVSFEENQGNAWKRRSRHQVTVFEFEGDKIRRIADYWAR